MTPRNPRVALVRAADPDCADLIRRLLRNSARALPQARTAGEFAFTLAGISLPDGGWQLAPAGTSTRYTAIAALGLLRLPGEVQQRMLDGGHARDLVGRLARQLDSLTDPADAALVCWAAAEAGDGELHRALARLAALDSGGPLPVTAAAWVVTALTAARPHADIEEQLAAARQRLLAARATLFPRTTDGSGPRHRAHVGSFADQVYAVQALARLHASGRDPEALAAAGEVAGAICQSQGDAGQWWWHYDARTGAVVEGYPVYSVHQYAMAPMALLDLAEAGGPDHLDAICQGLRWQAAPPETATPLILDDPPVCWRKVARGDRRQLVRGIRAAVTRLRPGLRLEMLDWLFPPGVVDYECRPYEPGWLLYAWLPAGGSTADRRGGGPGRPDRDGDPGRPERDGDPGAA